MEMEPKAAFVSVKVPEKRREGFRHGAMVPPVVMRHSATAQWSGFNVAGHFAKAERLAPIVRGHSAKAGRFRFTVREHPAKAGWFRHAVGEVSAKAEAYLT